MPLCWRVAIRCAAFDMRPSGITHARFHEVLGVFDDRAYAAAALDGITAVFHLGAFMSWLPQDQARLLPPMSKAPGSSSKPPSPVV